MSFFRAYVEIFVESALTLKPTSVPGTAMKTSCLLFSLSEMAQE